MLSVKSRRRAGALLFAAYCAFIVWYTVFSRAPSDLHLIRWEFMWSYRELLSGSSRGKADVIQNLFNVLFFVPYGLLFPKKRHGVWWVLLTALLLSAGVEAGQYIRGCGLCELDDVICNTLGALIGFGLGKLIQRIGSNASET